MKLSVSTSRSSIVAKSVNEKDILTYQQLLSEVHKQNKEEAERKKKKRMYVHRPTNVSQGYRPSYNPEQFNVIKKIKEIRTITKQKVIDPSKKSNIAFAKDKIDIVFESTKLLQELQKRKNNTLNDDESSLSAFLMENKEISIKNLLIKLLKKESNKLDSKEKNSDKLISDGRETYKADLQNFYSYSEMQNLN